MSSAPTPHKNWTLLAVCIGTFMLIVDMTIIVVALPSIRTSLHTNFSDLQWTISAYALSLASLLLPTGSLADIFGRRRAFATGLTIFTLGSLLCALSSSGTMLVLFRVVQGLGGATIFATSLALLAQTFHGKERGMAFGIWGSVVGAAGGIGPLMGGLLTTELSWRWIFYVNLPLGVIAIAMTLTKVQEFKPPHARRIDLPGFAVFTSGLFCLVFGLIKSGTDGWGSTVVVAMLIAAAVLLLTFPIVEHFREQPMFDFRLFRKPTFLGGSLAAFGINACLYSMLLYLTLYQEDAQHASPLGAGARLAVMTLTGVITGIPAGRLSARIPVRYIISAGLALIGVGLLLMRGLNGDSSWTHMIAGLIVAGAGAGFVNPALASTAVGVVQPHDAGMASGINSTFRQVGLAGMVAALGSLWGSHIAGSTPSTVAAHYAAGLDALLLITGVTALVIAAIVFPLIRSRDFIPHAAPTPVVDADQ